MVRQRHELRRTGRAPHRAGVVGRIEALKASIPRGTLDGIVANASVMTPAAALAMVAG